MPRKRWLPKNVTLFVDRHGKERYRFRKAGMKPRMFKSTEPGSVAFLTELNEILTGGKPMEQGSAAPLSAVVPYSFDALASTLYESPRWLSTKALTQRTRRQIIERFADTLDDNSKRYGSRDIRKATVAALDRAIGRLKDRPGAANNLRDALILLFTHAQRIGWIETNPAKLTYAFPTGPGFHTWTEAELEQYRGHHANGTMARLVMELALNTATRRCEVAQIERKHIVGAFIEVQHAKGGDPTKVPMLPETKAALEAMPVAPIRHLVVTTHGKPFSINGLGNKMREWADEAGLPRGCTIHGLRKAMSRRLAESGSSDAQGRSVTGQKDNETFAYYAAAANRDALAIDALANLQSKFGKPSPKSEE